ncbi:MAG: helix-turn-helix domain-containing protein [Sporomusaceae bacterium]|nr:helix-turn-helix domain-containing protein [Sporomusaceae bacterium]
MKKRELSSIPCPIEYTIELLSGKWKMHVVWQVAKQEVIRFNELRRQLNGISNVMLAQTLQELQEAGVINRNQYNEVPPRVEYSLTKLGKGLLPVFAALESWGKQSGWINPGRLPD